MSELRGYIYTKNPGDEVTLQVTRGGKTLEIRLKLGKKQKNAISKNNKETLTNENRENIIQPSQEVEQ